MSNKKMGYPEMPSFFKLLFVLIILAMGCKPTPRELTAIQKSVVTEEINDVMAVIESSVRKLDFEGILTFYLDSREVTIASDGTLFTDRNAYFSRFRALVKGIRGIESFEWTGKKIYPLSVERALFTGEFREKIIRDGEEPQKMQGAWTILFQKVNGKWKILHDHASHLPEWREKGTPRTNFPDEKHTDPTGSGVQKSAGASYY